MHSTDYRQYFWVGHDYLLVNATDNRRRLLTGLVVRLLMNLERADAWSVTKRS